MPIDYYPAAKEYANDRELKKEDVAALREWLDKQPHLPALNELELILFLHSCHYRNELAKTTIDNFYTSRRLCPEFFRDCDPRTDTFEKCVNSVLYAHLDKRTTDNCRVVYCKLIDTDPDVYQFYNQVKGFDMVTMLTLRREGTAPGVVIVIDMAGVVFAHVIKLNLIHLKKFFYYLQEAMPVRVKGIHFINSPSFIDKVMSLIKPFMKKELLEVLHVHTTDLSMLYPYVPKNCLPKELGGESPSIDEMLRSQRRTFLENAEYFVADEAMVADESRRPGKPKNETDVFGVEGTFKRLDID